MKLRSLPRSAQTVPRVKPRAQELHLSNSQSLGVPLDSSACPLSGMLISQNSDQSVADAAREAHAQKTSKAAKVHTDDDNGFRKSPLPQLSLDGDDNGEDVLDAILKYNETHKPEEVEKAVHDWTTRTTRG